MLISDIDLYEVLKEKLGEEEAKQLIEFLKQQAQSEVRLVAEEILQKIEDALSEIKAVEERSLQEVKDLIQNAIDEATKKIEETVDLKLNEIQQQLTRIETINERLESLESRLSEISSNIEEIKGKTGGVKGLMFFLWLLLIGTVIFNILLNIPATRDAILKAVSGGAQ